MMKCCLCRERERYFMQKVALHMLFSFIHGIACASTNQNWLFLLRCVNVSFRQIITNKMHAKHSKFKLKSNSLHVRNDFKLIQLKAIFATNIFFSLLSFLLSGFNFLALSQFHRLCVIAGLWQWLHCRLLDKNLRRHQVKWPKETEAQKWSRKKNRLTDNSWYIHKTDFSRNNSHLCGC